MQRAFRSGTGMGRLHVGVSDCVFPVPTCALAEPRPTALLRGIQHRHPHIGGTALWDATARASRHVPPPSPMHRPSVLSRRGRSHPIRSPWGVRLVPRDALEGRGLTPPSLCPATVPLTPSARLNGICNRQ